MLSLQTAEEKQLRKMCQREEKKQNRRKDVNRDVVDHGKVGFNPQELRSQRFVVWLKFSTSLLWLISLVYIDSI